MHCYEVVLRARSALETPLSAPTLWGHLCWGIRYQHGNQALEDWLARYDSALPPLVLSDPFPRGFWPVPHLPLVIPETSPPDVQTYDQRKRIRGTRWIPETLFRHLIRNLGTRSLLECLGMVHREGQSPPAPAEEVVLHASVNRLTGGTAQEGGGSLFGINTIFHEGQPEWSVWCLSPETVDTVRQWFEAGLVGGYGRNAASGRGHLIVLETRPAELPAADHPDASMTLGPALPTASDAPPLSTRSVMHWGRVGGDFSIGALPDGSVIRQKRPVIAWATGSLLETAPGRPWIGHAPAGVHPAFSAIRHCGMAPVIGVRVDPATRERLAECRRLADEPLAAASSPSPVAS